MNGKARVRTRVPDKTREENKDTHTKHKSGAGERGDVRQTRARAREFKQQRRWREASPPFTRGEDPSRSTGAYGSKGTEYQRHP